MKDKFASMMLDFRLNHLPIKESLELNNSPEKIKKTRDYWVINKEELPDWDDYDTDEIEFYISEIEKEYGSLEGAPDYILDIGNDYDHFEEFTLALCPAPTYMELIK